MDYRLRAETGRAFISPIGFHSHACKYLTAAKSLPVNEDYSPVPYYLFCHALELGLKAYLLAKGYRKDRLKHRNLGHDLVAVIAAANNQGLGLLFSLTPSEEKEIEKANAYYSSKEFEYFDNIFKEMTGNPDLPELSSLQNMTERLLTSIRIVCISVA